MISCNAGFIAAPIFGAAAQQAHAADAFGPEPVRVPMLVWASSPLMATVGPLGLLSRAGAAVRVRTNLLSKERGGRKPQPSPYTPPERWSAVETNRRQAHTRPPNDGRP